MTENVLSYNFQCFPYISRFLKWLQKQLFWTIWRRFAAPLDFDFQKCTENSFFLASGAASRRRWISVSKIVQKTADFELLAPLRGA